MTPEQAATLRWFRASEFSHVDLVDYAAAKWLDDVRELARVPLIVTCAARTAAENAAVGGADNSLHLDGRAFDLRYLFDAATLFAVVAAAMRTANGRPIEIEIEQGANAHLHLGLARPGYGASRLIVKCPS